MAAAGLEFDDQPVDRGIRELIARLLDGGRVFVAQHVTQVPSRAPSTPSFDRLVDTGEERHRQDETERAYRILQSSIIS
jgi:hypothetical protein